MTSNDHALFDMSRARARAVLAPEEEAHPGLYELRYVRPQRVFDIDDDADGTVSAEHLGLTREEGMRLLRRIDDIRAAVVDALLGDSALTAAIARVPDPGGSIAVVGDSMSADRLGWAELLGGLLTSLRPELVLRSTARGGDTTLDALSRFHLAAAHRPAVVIQLIGANDARRHGFGLAVPMCSPDDTRRGLRGLRAMCGHLGARRVVFSPLAGDERGSVVNRHGASWLPSDIEAVSELVLEVDPEATNLHASAVRLPSEEFLLADGLHPTLAGQVWLLHRVVAALSDAWR